MKKEQSHIDQIRERHEAAEAAAHQAKLELLAVQAELDRLVVAEEAKRPSNSNQLEIMAYIERQKAAREAAAAKAARAAAAGLDGPKMDPVDAVRMRKGPK